MKGTKQNIILKAAVVIGKKEKSYNVMSIGEDLLSLGADKIMDGGFWVWDIKNNIEYYSPKFREILEFEGEHDFPSTPESWQKQIAPEGLKESFSNYEKIVQTKGKEPYYQEVEYKTKNNKKINVTCSGALIMDDNEPRILIGTHTLK